LVIEVDGGQHSDNRDYDTTRDQWLKLQGYRVLRFWNNEVLTNIDGVMEIIHGAVNEPPPVSSPGFGGGKYGDAGSSNIALKNKLTKKAES